MIITLWGGPMDGRDISIPDDVWRSRRVLVPVPRTPYWFVDGGPGLRIAVYVCQRWIPAWAGQCAMPQYLWKFDHEERG